MTHNKACWSLIQVFHGLENNQQCQMDMIGLCLIQMHVKTFQMTCWHHMEHWHNQPVLQRHSDMALCDQACIATQQYSNVLVF